jgi:glycogen debranching enzyme
MGMYTEFTDYLSRHRQEKIQTVTESIIKYPNNKISIQDAFDSVLKEYEPGKFVFVAAGVMEGNEAHKEANLFNTVFGRDGLIMLDFYQSIKNKNVVVAPVNLILDCLCFYAMHQGVQHVGTSEQEIGKIFHEYREPNDPIALELKAQRDWDFPYYGGIDTTFHYIKQLSIFLLHNPKYSVYKVVNKLNSLEYTLQETLELAYEYTKKTIKNNLVHYTRLNDNGIEIQSWRDSYDSISNKEGNLPDFNQDLALLDLQLVAIEAYRDLKTLLPDAKEFEISIHITNLLKGLDTMWVPTIEGGYYAAGIQNNELFDIVTSTNLIALKYDFIDQQTKSAIFNHCYPRLLVENGIATIGTDEHRYHLSGYHTGNVWIFDNVLCYQGLLANGNLEQAELLKSSILNIIKKTNCYPELVGSQDCPNIYIIDVYDVVSNRTNRICQPGQPLQGWSILGVAAIL